MGACATGPEYKPIKDKESTKKLPDVQPPPTGQPKKNNKKGDDALFDVENEDRIYED